MSYGFGSAVGTSNGDNIRLPISPNTYGRSYAIRVKRNGVGGGGLGRFFEANNETQSEALFWNSTDSSITYNRNLTSQGAGWRCPQPSSDLTGWHTYGISRNNGTNATPLMCVDGVSKTVSVNGSAPSGGAIAISSYIYLGNRATDLARCLDGWLGYFAAWNIELTEQQHADYAAGADPRYDAGWTGGSKPSGLISYVPLSTDATDLVGGSTTVTGAKFVSDNPNAVASGGVGLSTGSASGGSAIGGDAGGSVVAIGGSGVSSGSGSGGDAVGFGVAATLFSPEDRGNIWLAQSSISNATSSAPTVTMSPRRQVNEQKLYSGTDDTYAKGYFFYGGLANVVGKKPLYKMKFWSSASHSEATELFKWHAVNPLGTNYKPVWSYDARTWNYFDHCAWNADGLYLDFYNDAAFSQDTVYFATSFPWQTDKTAEWIASLIALNSPYLSQPASAVAYGGDPYQIGLTTARQNELGEAIAPVKVYALRVSSGGLDPNGHQKANVLFTAGTHAGEDLGNWALKGALEFLLTEHPKAQLFRQWCNGIFDPMTDSSGRRGGHRRSHFDPVKLTADGNRYWGVGTLANTNMIVDAILLDTGGHFAASFDFHAGHSEVAYYDAQVQTSNDTWHTAIQTYIPGIIRHLGDIPNSAMGWAETTIGAKICVTPEYDWNDTHTTAEIEAFGASHVKAIADVAATNYLYTATPGVASGGTGVSVGSGFGGDAVGVTNATATGGTGAGDGSGSGGNASGSSGTPGTAFGGTGTGTGLGTGGNAVGVSNAATTGGAGTAVGSGSGGDAAGIVAGSATASGGIGSGVGSGSGGSASAVANAAANGGTGTGAGSGHGGNASTFDPSAVPLLPGPLSHWVRALPKRWTVQSNLRSPRGNPMPLPIKDPEEVKTITFDFSADADRIESATPTALYLKGEADASPQDVIYGSPTIDGALVMVRVKEGQNATSYAIRCKAFDADGEVHILSAELPVANATPV